MKFSKAQNQLLTQIQLAPVEFAVEWLTWPDGVSLAHIVKNHGMYWRADFLRTAVGARVTELATVPGRSNVKKFSMAGSTVIKTYRIEL